MARYNRRTFDNQEAGRVQTVDMIDIDLSIARTDELVEVPGNFWYLDKNTNGDIDIKLNRKANPAMPAGANMGLDGVPFGQLYITNAAQAGKMAYLWYGLDARIIPPNQDIANIGRVDAVTMIDEIQTRTIGNALISIIGTLGTTLQTIVTPAANTNGIHVDQLLLRTSAGNGANVMTKASAPTSWNDAASESLLYVNANVTYGNNSGRNDQIMPYIIPAGLGLYAQANGGTNNALLVRGEVL